LISLFAFMAIVFGSCSNDHYTLEDFYRVKKIDTHTHINTLDGAIVEQALHDNFKLLTINVDVPTYPPLPDQRRFAWHQAKRFPHNVSYLAAFTLQHCDSAEFSNEVIGQLDSSFAAGALGIKLWKNIGMVYKDSADQFIMIDNPRFDSIIEHLIQMDKTVMGHLGEPKNCWLPLSEMTVNNDRRYFENNPQYHMYLHPEYPSYDDQINARDRFVERHPKMRFVGAHLGSLEWDVDELAKRLDKFPNMAVDVAARVPHIQFQSLLDREKVRNFLIRYQDRIIYATDADVTERSNPDTVKANVHNTWMMDWTYFATDQIMTVEEVNGEFQGLQLPREVIDKLYRYNAIRWFRMNDD
jgi:hypothetical protein